MRDIRSQDRLDNEDDDLHQGRADQHVKDDRDFPQALWFGRGLSFVRLCRLGRYTAEVWFFDEKDEDEEIQEESA